MKKLILITLLMLPVTTEAKSIERNYAPYPITIILPAYTFTLIPYLPWRWMRLR